MSIWDTYPENYRSQEVQAILRAIRAGECVSVIGLSGAGKSNLFGFLAHRVPWEGEFVLVDCNRLLDPEPEAFFQLVYRQLAESAGPENDSPFEALADTLARAVDAHPEGVCLLLDRFDALADEHTSNVASNLRALRDAHKYQLTLATATRRPLAPDTELAELVFANTLWLGPLSESDSRWNVARYAARKSLSWDEDVARKMIDVSWGYPALLRAVSEAHSMGCPLTLDALREHPAVTRRAREFWADDPTDEMLHASGLARQPLLFAARAPHFDTAQLTAKEHLLLDYFLAHPDEVCEKDDLIRAVWPEDHIFEEGVRDDSLAQLVRRLRVKIEPDPSSPTYIQTVPGRGYLFNK